MKYINLFIDLIKLIIAKCLSPMFKIVRSNRDVWLIGERKSEAKDNGYHLFKYVRENYPDKKVYYVISKDSSDWEKVYSLGNVVVYDSLKHYILYVLSTKLICAHLGSCVPDSPICWKFYERDVRNKKKVFIQHGITKELIPSLVYESTKCDMFICGGKPEYEFVKSTFGYPEGSVQYTGFARFDNLHDNEIKNKILVMPTWRQWIPSATWNSGDMQKCRELFLQSDYYARYNNLINSKTIINLLEKYNLELIFYPHYEMQGYIDLFSASSSRVTIARKENYDVQQLLKESKILITDYSSIAFDFAYMRKVVLYYQFDEDVYYKNHYQKGYFDYKEHGFGPVVKDLIEVEMCLAKVLAGINDGLYKERSCVFFEKYDNRNCERIFNEIICIK